MKAIVYDRWGGPEVLRVAERPEPFPARGEVVVDVHALAVNPKDVLVRKGKVAWMPGVSLPLVPGHDLAGIVVRAGPGADLEAGTRVYGWLESVTGGASAERVAIPARCVAPKPEKLSMGEAASVPLGALTALQALRDDLDVRPGEHLVVNGASGGVGVFAVQLGRLFGARVTAVSSARNRDLVLGLGADAHLDHAVADPLDLRDVDAFFDVFGNKPWRQARRTLTRGGRYCTTLPRPDTIRRGALARIGLHRASLVVVRSRRADLEQLSGWLRSGSLRPVIDRVFSWTDLAEAHRHVETRHARGKVVLTVHPDAMVGSTAQPLAASDDPATTGRQ